MGNCCDKGNQHEDHKKVSKKLMIINGRWRTGRVLGKGGYGKVYEVHDTTDNDKPYAMKTEHLRPNDMTGRLPQEALVLEQMASKGKTRHVPRLMDKGRIEMEPGIDPVQFIVMSLLGPSLADMRKFCHDIKMSPATVAMIAVQTIESVEDVHLTGYVHRDIKPGNFMIGIGPNKHNIYMIDFGMARNIYDKEGKLLPMRERAPFRGTPLFCASESHQGIEYGRHHDLFCLFNSLIQLRKGELPWQQLEGDWKGTYDIKRKIIPERWLADVEPQYKLWFEHLTALHYDISPPYPVYRNMFIEILQAQNLTVNSPFEWEEANPLYSKFDRSVLLKLFHEKPIINVKN